jgi:uncharacterized protein YegP (UPF0339 family)
MRWHPPTEHLTRVIVWLVYKTGRRWTWSAKARNGRVLVISAEKFTSRDQAVRAAITFGRPPTFTEFNKITALHDGRVLVIKWSD